MVRQIQTPAWIQWHSYLVWRLPPSLIVLVSWPYIQQVGYFSVKVWTIFDYATIHSMICCTFVNKYQCATAAFSHQIWQGKLCQCLLHSYCSRCVASKPSFWPRSGCWVKSNSYPRRLFGILQMSRPRGAQLRCSSTCLTKVRPTQFNICAFFLTGVSI